MSFFFSGFAKTNPCKMHTKVGLTKISPHKNLPLQAWYSLVAYVHLRAFISVHTVKLPRRLVSTKSWGIYKIDELLLFWYTVKYYLISKKYSSNLLHTWVSVRWSLTKVMVEGYFYILYFENLMTFIKNKNKESWQLLWEVPFAHLRSFTFSSTVKIPEA